MSYVKDLTRSPQPWHKPMLSLQKEGGCFVFLLFNYWKNKSAIYFHLINQLLAHLQQLCSKSHQNTNTASVTTSQKQVEDDS